jgi:hypothetical protein
MARAPSCIPHGNNVAKLFAIVSASYSLIRLEIRAWWRLVDLAGMRRRGWVTMRHRPYRIKVEDDLLAVDPWMDYQD